MTVTDIAALVERLRALVIIDEVGSDNPLGRDAADALEALHGRAERAEFEVETLVERLRKAEAENEALKNTYRDDGLEITSLQRRAEKSEAALLNAQERYIAARNAALETAARVADDYERIIAPMVTFINVESIARRIRALGDKP